MKWSNPHLAVRGITDLLVVMVCLPILLLLVGLAIDFIRIPMTERVLRQVIEEGMAEQNALSVCGVVGLAPCDPALATTAIAEPYMPVAHNLCELMKEESANLKACATKLPLASAFVFANEGKRADIFLQSLAAATRTKLTKSLTPFAPDADKTFMQYALLEVPNTVGSVPIVTIGVGNDATAGISQLELPNIFIESLPTVKKVVERLHGNLALPDWTLPCGRIESLSEISLPVACNAKPTLAYSAWVLAILTTRVDAYLGTFFGIGSSGVTSDAPEKQHPGIRLVSAYALYPITNVAGME